VSDPDLALLDGCRSGDERAFAELVSRYHTRLLRLASSFVPSAAVAEEVVQDTWIAVVRGANRFEGRSSVRTWLFRICVNRARTTGGREPRHTSLDDADDPLEGRFDADGHWSDPPVPWSDAVEDRLVAESVAARVKAHLDDLPEAQRQVVVLRDVEGLEASEVCDLLGISAGNQRVLLHRGRARLRALVDAEMAIR
jgi:RNA polymerase sigma-70 factor (ECF subfamily)